MNKVTLSKNQFIARGGERDVYHHPNDKSKVIKIVFSKTKHNNQNKLDYRYYQYLRNRKINFNHIAKCYDFIDTNHGIGLICEEIKNYDNSKIRTLSHCVRFNLLDEKLLLDLILELKKYLFDNNILFIDASLSNIFCQKIGLNKYKLVIFDGLGARRTGFKFQLYLHCSFITKYKIKKQWKVFINNYKNEYNSKQ